MSGARDGGNVPGLRAGEDDLDTDELLRQCLALVAAARADVEAARAAAAMMRTDVAAVRAFVAATAESRT